jgi:large subunit ribosomal protein L1
MVSAEQTLPFDILLATPETAAFFRQHGRILGPKGLMPSEKRGTVVSDFTSYMTHEEKGIELKLDSEGKTSKGATVRVVVGKVPPAIP